MKLEDREINAIVGICNNPKIKNKGKYFAKIVSRNNLEGTLAYIRRVLKRNIEAMPVSGAKDYYQAAYLVLDG